MKKNRCYCKFLCNHLQLPVSYTHLGIILTDNAKNVPSYATVVAIGPESKADIKENDKVVYKEYSGTNVKLDEEEYIIIEAEDILAVLA